jgi:ferritin-like metal-binding protein YciE
VIASARELFLHRLRTILWIEETLAAETLPRLRGLVHTTDLVWAVERHQLETEAHVRNLGRVFVLAGTRVESTESVAFRGLAAEAERLLGAVDEPALVDLAALEVIAQTEHLEIASYVALEHLAQALAVDRDVVYLLRTNMEQDAFALEQAEHALAKLLAEKVESSR